jgi:hypothetical protein
MREMSSPRDTLCCSIDNSKTGAERFKREETYAGGLHLHRSDGLCGSRLLWHLTRVSEVATVGSLH